MAVVIFGAQRDLMLPAFHQVAARHAAVLVRRREDLDRGLIERVRPDWVILPDWSWIVPAELLALARFAGFHAADLPAYRGGSPLQHQILDGLEATMLSCIRLVDGIDAGGILLQRPLSLQGTIGGIWERIAGLVPGMTLDLLDGRFSEQPQKPGGFVRRRRTPQESRIPDFGMDLARLHDWMRALDDPYPNAFTTIADKRISFSAPRLDDQGLHAEVLIRKEPSDG